jgi:hypothetical protein
VVAEVLEVNRREGTTTTSCQSHSTTLGVCCPNLQVHRYLRQYEMHRLHCPSVSCPPLVSPGPLDPPVCVLVLAYCLSSEGTMPVM